jgi:hypothetical protein
LALGFAAARDKEENLGREPDDDCAHLWSD